MGMRLGNVKEEPSGRQSGIVLTQMPEAGTQLSAGSYVSIVVGGRRAAPSPRPVEIPIRQKPAQSTTPANWSAPNLLAIEIVSNGATIHASDGRVFTSNDRGDHWKGELPAAALFSADITGGVKLKAFKYRYI